MSQHFCGDCDKAASFVCTRCKCEYYCSKKCQVSAFPKHRSECFSLPQLKIIDEIQNLVQNNSDDSDLSVAELKPLDEEKVPIKQKLDDPIEKTTMPIKVKVQAEAIVEKKPAIEPTKEKVEQKPGFNQGTRTVAPNSYQNIPPVVSIPKQSEQKQQEIVEEKVPEKKVFSNTIRNQSPMMSQPMKVPKETRYFYKDLKERNIHPGDIKIKLINGNQNDKIFYALEATALVESFMQYIESNISEFVKNDKSTSYKPISNEMVLAKFDDMYYRAVVQEISKSNTPIYDVYFVDYGNYAQVKETDIKPFSIKLKNEIVLMQIYLANFPENMTEKQGEILSAEDGFNICITEKAENCYLATITDI